MVPTCCFTLRILFDDSFSLLLSLFSFPPSTSSSALIFIQFLLDIIRYGHDENGDTTVRLAMASTNDPTTNSNWTRFGPVSYFVSFIFILFYFTITITLTFCFFVFCFLFFVFCFLFFCFLFFYFNFNLFV